MAPLRFNQKDLQFLATQSSDKFHKEGLLFFKEKEGKYFNKSEVYTERFFRLYGNLLFHFKGRDKTTECAGVIVLENFVLLPDRSREYAFVIEFEKSDEQKYEFAAMDEADYDAWMKIIQSSSYERLRQRLDILRTQISQMTGVDPLPDKTSDDYPQPLDEPSSNDDILMEMCLACKDLIGEGPICAMVRISTVNPPETDWIKHSQTEISEESKCPNFLRTIVISKSFTSLTRVKFVIYNVLSRTKGDVIVLGQSVCTMQEIQQSPNWQLYLSIRNVDTNVGTLLIQGWQRESGHPFSERRLTITQRDPLQSNQVRSFVTNIVQRSFRVPTTEGHDLKFQELLAESFLCYKIPKLLLGLYIAEEKESVMELHNMGQLHPEWDRVKQTIQNSHFNFVQQYSSSMADLFQFEEESNFKRSADKARRELEFVPTNLHLQRQCVIDNNEEFLYDVVTVGAPTAFSLKYKHGGLKRLIKTCEENTRKVGCMEEERRKTWYNKASNLRDVFKETKDKLRCCVKDIKKAIEEENYLSLDDHSTQLSCKIGELLKVQRTSFVQDVEKQLERARTIGPSLRIDRVEIATDIDDADIKNLVWEWTGTEFKSTRSPGSVESDCGVSESMLKFLSLVNQTKIDETFTNKDSLLDKLDGLEKAIESCIRKLFVQMRFILMQEEIDYVGMRDIRYRNDIVFSQALTPIVAGLTLLLARRIYDQQFIKQLVHCGLLIYFECLLSTYGDETGMIEDMVVGVQDLKNVSFQIISSDTDSFPVIHGKRSKLVVELPVKSKAFKILPEQLQKETFQIHPVLFTMGINESATLAEKFGDTSLQESINIENFYNLQEYLESFRTFAPDHIGSRNSNAQPLEALMEELKTTILAKKYKNIDIFTLAEEICFRMNSLRLTSCKSAKDRTSMSVTLEFVRTLMREHQMSKAHFQMLLDSLRSQGTRLINSHKNVGLSKYAFNKVQVLALPVMYRPPEGTTGKAIQT